MQCRYVVGNTKESIRTRLMKVANSANNVLRPRGRNDAGSRRVFMETASRLRQVRCAMCPTPPALWSRTLNIISLSSTQANECVLWTLRRSMETCRLPAPV